MKPGDLIKIMNDKYVADDEPGNGYNRVMKALEMLVVINCEWHDSPEPDDDWAGLLKCEMLHREMGVVNFYAHPGELVKLS
jgi:hypothetical protein